MSDGKGAADGGRYEAGDLGRVASEEAKLSVDEARAKGDYANAWKIARERVGVLLQLGLVEVGEPEAAITFEKIVRIAREANEQE